MPLKISDGMGAWIDDFQKSDAPQFKGKNKEERREMAIAAYLSAKRGDKKESVEEARAPKMTYALVGAKDMKIYSMGSDERDLKLDRRSLEKRFKQPLKLARLKTAQSIGDKVDKSQIKENIEEATSRADLARAMAAFQKRGGKVKKVAPGKAAGYHGKDDPGKDVHGIMGRPDTKKIGTRKKVRSMGEEIDEMTQQSKTHSNLKIAVGKSAQSIKSTKARIDKRKMNRQGTPLAANTVLGELSPETVKGYKKAAGKSNYSAAQQYARVAASPTSRKYKNKEMDRLDNIGRKRKAGLAMADRKSVGESVNESVGDHEDAANAHQMAANSARQDLRAKKAHMSAASHHIDAIKHLNKGDRASAAMSHRAAKSQSKIARRYGNATSHSAHADTHSIRTEAFNTAGESVNEEMMFKVSVDGLPPMIMLGRSPGDIKGQLRKIVKQPSMITDVERMTKADVRKRYRDMAKGDDSIDEAKVLGGAREIDTKAMSAYMKYAKAKKIDDDSIRMTIDNPNHPESKRMMQNKSFATALKMYKAAIK